MPTPPGFRDADSCCTCKHVKCTHSCGCCPQEHKCTLHDYDVGGGDGWVCDDYVDEDEE